MPKKHFILKLVLATLMLVTLFYQSSVMASPLTSSHQVTVFHSSPEKSFVAGKDSFKFRHFTSDAGQGAKTIATAEILLAPNYDGFLLQKHVVNVDETIFVTNGDVKCFTSQPNNAIAMKAGDVIQIPAGVPYGCKASGSEPSRLLLVTSSPALENLIAEIGTPSDSQTLTTTEPNMEKVAAAAQKYGIEFLN